MRSGGLKLRGMKELEGGREIGRDAKRRARSCGSGLRGAKLERRFKRLDQGKTGAKT